MPETGSTRRVLCTFSTAIRRAGRTPDEMGSQRQRGNLQRAGVHEEESGCPRRTVSLSPSVRNHDSSASPLAALPSIFASILAWGMHLAKDRATELRDLNLLRTERLQGTHQVVSGSGTPDQMTHLWQRLHLLGHGQAASTPWAVDWQRSCSDRGGKMGPRL